jgi:hypothetical protein
MTAWVRTLILLTAGSVGLTACPLSFGDDFGPQLIVHNMSTEPVYVQDNPNSMSELIVAPPGVMGGAGFVGTGYVLNVFDIQCRRIESATVPPAEDLVLLTIGPGLSLEIRALRTAELPETNQPGLSVTDECADPVVPSQ